MQNFLKHTEIGKFQQFTLNNYCLENVLPLSLENSHNTTAFSIYLLEKVYQNCENYNASLSLVSRFPYWMCVYVHNSLTLCCWNCKEIEINSIQVFFNFSMNCGIATDINLKNRIICQCKEIIKEKSLITLNVSDNME